MTLDQLVAFLAVAQAGTFAAASQRLHKSQPAVSKLVSNLEQELGLSLFDRSAYRPVLTDAGALIQQRAALIATDLEALRELAQELSGKVEAKVRLVVESVTPLEPVMVALASVRDVHPGARLELRTETLASTLDRLRSGDADLAIAQMSDVHMADLEGVPFASVSIAPVAHRDHPLAQAAGPLDARTLAPHVQVILSESAPSSSSYSLNVMPGGQRWFVSDVGAKLQVIRAGLGWGGLPLAVVAEDLTAGTLVQLDIPAFSVRTMHLSLLRRGGMPEGPIAQALWRALVH